MIDLDSVSVAKDTLVSAGNAVTLSVLVPGVDFLKLELPGIEIVVGSLIDCECFEDTAETSVSLNSSWEESFCPDFSAKPVSPKALLEELVFSLGSNVSVMLENLFEIELLLPWTEILQRGNLE